MISLLLYKWDDTNKWFARVKHFEFQQDHIEIGRDRGNIILAHATVSSKHACITKQENETYILKDLKSTNGTYHNDKLIEMGKVGIGQPLKTMDVIGIGPYRMEVILGKVDIITATANITLQGAWDPYTEVTPLRNSST